MDGRCTSISGNNNNICDGTSVLNDGIIPTLSGVSDDQSQWAAQLFTMGRPMAGRIILSFEVEHTNHDRVELTVFNCPGRSINTPVVNVYVDTSFRPASANSNSTLTNMVTNQSLLNMSCDHLIKFCVDFNSGVSSPYFNLEFPYQMNSNSEFVFLGEVTFLSDSIDCGPPELITMPATLQPLPTG